MRVGPFTRKHASWLIDKVWIAGAYFGIAGAYFAWAVQRRRWGHAVAAVGVYFGLWATVPFVLSWCIHILQALHFRLQ